METDNDYLNLVVAAQAQVEDELRAQSRRKPGAVQRYQESGSGIDFDEGGRTSHGRAVDFRITGWWRWKTVVVPPSAYVVHTRRGHADPIHVGLGLSFRYNPATDAFLVIPAVVQTLLINARCICQERQGVLVQAYVQWLVDDVRTAYRKLDFSDADDPMRVVNVQLREQAEAAIKDKVATMSIDDILSDKEPIIEELTHRLRGVAEGNRAGDPTSGLGLKIVTVQIKEAVVSSTKLWENLQKPFRAERERLARLAELDTAEQLAQRELAVRQRRESEELEVGRQLDQLRFARSREEYDRQQLERVRRHQLEQQEEQRAIENRTLTEKSRLDAELELKLHQLEMAQRRTALERQGVQQEMELDQVLAERDRLRTQRTVEREDVEHAGRTQREQREVELFRSRRQAENDLAPSLLQSQLIAQLPTIAASLPRSEEHRSITIGGEGAATTGPLLGFLAGLLELAEGKLGQPSANGTHADK